MKILLVEDDPTIHETLLDNLEFEGYQADSCYDGKSGLETALKNRYDLLILDLTLPGMEGMEILKRLRKAQIETPVIILTARNSEEKKLEGFREGADDYVCKPFSLPELMARIKAVVKRTIPVSTDNQISIGKGVFDLDKQLFTVDGHSEECNRYEIRILKLISIQKGKIYSRDEILHYAWGADQFPTDRTVDNYIVKLRKKLSQCLPGHKQEILESIYGEGYRLNV